MPRSPPSLIMSRLLTYYVQLLMVTPPPLTCHDGLRYDLGPAPSTGLPPTSCDLTRNSAHNSAAMFVTEIVIMQYYAGLGQGRHGTLNNINILSLNSELRQQSNCLMEFIINVS